MYYNFLKYIGDLCMSSHQTQSLEKKVGVIFQEHYLDIINSVADAVYWTDSHCNLIGCNKNFIKLMRLKSVRNLTTPYELMSNHAHWSSERVEELKLDDMNTLFAAQPQYDIEENAIVDAKNKNLFFKSTRVPMFDHKHKVMGLIVVLTDITPLVLLRGTKKRIAFKTTLSTSLDQALSHSSKVLMVEDNLIAQNVERALLTALNCQVDIADTGNKAIELFNPGKYDLVFMDIGLEDTSGYVVAKKFRTKEENTKFHVPIIALKGYEADVVKNDCELMDGAITKPLSREQAEKIIKHYVYHMDDIKIPGLKRI